ncbi:MAG: isoprenylcysteine carboxylmethyltransferase family protein [Ignavibacteriae bacterium]|nr:isoprenylcysteine carboxylmethyltransferase family protein [Ignavibacteriota bacterium]
METSLVVMAVSILWISSEVILSQVKRSDGGEKSLDRSSLRFLWIAITVGVTGGIVLSKQRVGHWGTDATGTGIAGLVLILSGIALRWCAIMSLKQHFTVDVAIAKDHRIVKTGLYGVIRHPAYAGTLLSFFGLGVYFMNSLSVLVIIVPIAAAFLYRIRVEEEALLGAFGDEYRVYQAATKRLIPGIY